MIRRLRLAVFGDFRDTWGAANDLGAAALEVVARVRTPTERELLRQHFQACLVQLRGALKGCQTAFQAFAAELRRIGL